MEKENTYAEHSDSPVPESTSTSCGPQESEASEISSKDETQSRSLSSESVILPTPELTHNERYTDNKSPPVATMEDDNLTDSGKRPIESPVSVAASDTSSTRPNKRKRKGTAPTRHIQAISGRIEKENDPDDEDVNSDSEFDKAYSEIDKANNRKLLEEFETKSEILSRPESVNEPIISIAPVRPEKYGPPRLDLFGPPQHYLDLFGPPVRESTDNCSVVIRGIGEEEIYCGPGDKDPGDLMIPLRTSNY